MPLKKGKNNPLVSVDSPKVNPKPTLDTVAESHNIPPLTDTVKIPDESSFNKFLIVAICIFLFAFGFRLGENKNQLRTSLASTPLAPLLKSSDSTPLSPPSGMKSALESNNKSIDFGLFWEAWDKVTSKYVDRAKADPQKMYYGAIKGMMSSFEDPHTFFLSPDENKQSKESLGGRFEGIGAQLGTKDGAIVIIAPIPNSPALAAGLKAGDLILEVNGVSIKGEPLPQVVSKIRGPAGSKVTLKIARGAQISSFDITRDKIQVNIFEVTTEGQTKIVKMSQFGDNTISEWSRISKEIADEYAAGKITGMVLDLRDNPGGYLEASVQIASEFLPYQELVVKQEFADRSIDYRATRIGQLPKIPVTVLVNKGSASASEILAGALRDHKRAKIVGEKSYGKGSVQEVFDLSSGAGLHVTVAKWVLPKGDWINGKGIMPEYEVKNPELDTSNTVDARKKDEQLNKAIQLLK